MNDNFDFSNDFNNEINMTEDERKSHKKIFSKLAFGFLVYLLIAQLVSIIAVFITGKLAPHLYNSEEFMLALSSVIQYVIALPVFWLCIKSIPKHAPVKNRVNAKRVMQYLVVCMFFMYVGNYISTFLMTEIETLLGRTPENAVNTLLGSTNLWVSALIVGIIGPIFEELIFRKLCIDRLTPYGEVTAILLPSFIFGLFHGNLYQFFYAFLIGVILSYVYVKTGKIIYSMGIHIFINMFCGILPSLVFTMLDYNELMTLVESGAITEAYISANALPILLFIIYSYGMLAMVGVGMFVLLRNIKNIQINKGEVRFPKGTALETVMFNAGTIVLVATCLILVALNTFGT